MVYHKANLSLWKNQQESFALIENEPIIPENSEYDLLKKFTHIPLLIQTLLMSMPTPLTRIEKLCEELIRIEQNIFRSDSDAAQQKMILEKSIIFLKSLLHAESLLPEYLNKVTNQYMQSVSQVMELNSARATDIQLQRLDAIMQRWVRKHAIHLQENHILITGTAEPRDGLIEMQYCMHLYAAAGLKDEAQDKVHYLEMLPRHLDQLDIKSDLIEDYLARGMLNQQYGLSLWKNKNALRRDVLGGFADAAIAKLIKNNDSMARSSKKKDFPY